MNAGAAVESARQRATAAVEGKARAVLYYMRTADMGLIPAGCGLEDVKAAAVAVREEDFASAWNPTRLPGLRVIVGALGLSDIPTCLDFILRLKAPVVDPDPGAVRLRLGLAVQ
jgi:hypothetical protein